MHKADVSGVMVVGTTAPRPPCTVCGTAYEKHGSYPACASHPYSPDGRCGHVGTFADGRFTGVPCAGAECRNGCARSAGVMASEPKQEPVALVIVREGAEDEFFWAGKGVLLKLPPGEYDLYLAPNAGVDVPRQPEQKGGA